MIIPQSATIPPTERSISPVARMSVYPRATTVMTTIWSSSAKTLDERRKYGEATARTTARSHREDGRLVDEEHLADQALGSGSDRYHCATPGVHRAATECREEVVGISVVARSLSLWTR